MSAWTAAVALLVVTLPLAVVAVTIRPAGWVFRAVTVTLTVVLVIVIAVTGAVLARDAIDPGVMVVLASCAIAVFTAATINTRRLQRRQGALLVRLSALRAKVRSHPTGHPPQP